LTVANNHAQSKHNVHKIVVYIVTMETSYMIKIKLAP